MGKRSGRLYNKYHASENVFVSEAQKQKNKWETFPLKMRSKVSLKCEHNIFFHSIHICLKNKTILLLYNFYVFDKIISYMNFLLIFGLYLKVFREAIDTQLTVISDIRTDKVIWRRRFAPEKNIHSNTKPPFSERQWNSGCVITTKMHSFCAWQNEYIHFVFDLMNIFILSFRLWRILLIWIIIWVLLKIIWAIVKKCSDRSVKSVTFLLF